MWWSRRRARDEDRLSLPQVWTEGDFAVYESSLTDEEKNWWVAEMVEEQKAVREQVDVSM